MRDNSEEAGDEEEMKGLQRRDEYGEGKVGWGKIRVGQSTGGKRGEGGGGLDSHPVFKGAQLGASPSSHGGRHL